MYGYHACTSLGANLGFTIFFNIFFGMNKDQNCLTSKSNMSCILFIYSYFFNVQVNLIYRTWDDSLKPLKISHLVKSRGITQEWQNTNNLWIWFGWQLSNKIPQNWITQIGISRFWKLNKSKIVLISQIANILEHSTKNVLCIIKKQRVSKDKRQKPLNQSWLIFDQSTEF